jgi:hypothetical protein
MPITGEEFEAGRAEPSSDADAPIDDEKELILSFLSEREGRAFTEREIVMGVDFSPIYERERGGRPGGVAGPAVDGLVEVAGEVAASAIVVDDVDEALSALVDEGAVERKEIESGDGTAVYYRLAE